jgi:predicted DNA-binding WGR domain protein
MRLLLQQRPVGAEAPRFVQLILQQDLLGGWTLTRESGQVGGRSQLKREQFLEREAAVAAFERSRDQHVKKGFQVMFTQGAGAPQ